MKEKKNNEIKKILDPKWVINFFSPKIKKYWPKTKKILSVKIEPLRVFLNYERLSCRYSFTLLNSAGRKEIKNIVLKAQKIRKDFFWPPRIGTVRRDFLALNFLSKNKLNISPRFLDFYPQLHAYAYEEIPGFTIKKFLPKNKKLQIKKFLNYLPAVSRAIKKVHAIKKQPPYATPEIEKKLTLNFSNSLCLIKKFYPTGFKKFQAMSAILKLFSKKYNHELFDKKNFTLTHGDFQMDNILVSKNEKIILIDWADSNFFNPLDDLGSFFAQTELHLKYVRPKGYKTVLEKIKKTFIQSYFQNNFNISHQRQIDYFAANDILRIITFISFTQSNWHPVNYSDMMESLFTYAEKKIRNLKRQYL